MTTFNKKEREKKRQKRKQAKKERREQRKMEKADRGKLTLEEQFSYVDENGNLTSTPPDPSKKKKIKLSDISLDVPSNSVEAPSKERTGTVNFFNAEKGYGFITDSDNGQSIFVHINNVDGDLAEHDKVAFTVEKGDKGPVAVNVELI